MLTRERKRDIIGELSTKRDNRETADELRKVNSVQTYHSKMDKEQHVTR